MGKAEFLNADAPTNVDWAAQQVLHSLTDEELAAAMQLFEKLDKALCKEWAKSLPFSEIKQAVDHAATFINK